MRIDFVNVCRVECYILMFLTGVFILIYIVIYCYIIYRGNEFYICFYKTGF